MLLIDLQRARETAEIVSEFHKDIQLVEVDELAEISWGEWEGLQSPHLPDLLKNWESGDYTAKAPVGESPLEVEKRAVPALYDCITKYAGKRLLFVCMFSRIIM